MTQNNVPAVVKNNYGFYELDVKPTLDELRSYYQTKYYQNAAGSYEIRYSEEELTYFKNKIAQKYRMIERLSANTANREPDQRHFLDVGCGEGWALSYFITQGWRVTGLDYSEYGCSSQNNDCLDTVIAGDIFLNIEKLLHSECSFDVILLDNVLEHVLDPLTLLHCCRKLLKHDGILVIEVPNDFSSIQEHLLQEKFVSRPYWIAAPDHISYFTAEGLNAICADAGFTCSALLADFPVEWNLLNSHTRYVEDATKGKECHLARVRLENLIHSISPDKAIVLYQALADLGMGRCINGFFKKTSTI